MRLRSRIAALFGRKPAALPGLDAEAFSPDPAVRREYHRRSLDENLEETARARGFGPAERAAWVAEHVEIYATRCVGFAAVLAADSGSLRDSVFFGMVEIGTEALRRELDASTPSPAAAAAWREFLDRLAATRVAADFERLAAAAGELRAALGGTDPYGRRVTRRSAGGNAPAG